MREDMDKKAVKEQKVVKAVIYTNKIQKDFSRNVYSARENRENFMTEVTHRLGHERHLRFQQMEGVKTRLMK